MCVAVMHLRMLVQMLLCVHLLRPCAGRRTRACTYIRLVLCRPVRRNFRTIDPHAVGVQAHVPDNWVVAAVVPIVDLAAGPVCGCPCRLSVLSVMYMMYVSSVVSVAILVLHLVWHIWPL